MSFGNWTYRFKKGDTSKIIDLDLMSSNTLPYTAYDETDFGVCSYSRPDQGNAGATTITLVSATRGTWTSGGIIEKDSTNAKGVYEFGVPNAALASGADWVMLTLQNLGNTTVIARILIWLDDPTPNVNVSTISNNAVTASAIASDAITAAKIASDAITAAKIASDAITSAKIAADAITSSEIADNAITAAKIATDAITASKIAANAITSSEIADAALTPAKFSGGVPTLPVGSITGTVASSPTDDGFTLTLSSALSIFDAAGAGLLRGYTARFTSGTHAGLEWTISDNPNGAGGGGSVGLLFDPPIPFTPTAGDGVAILDGAKMARRAGERTGEITSVDAATFTLVFTPDMPESSFGAQEEDQFAGCRLRIETKGSVSTGGTPGIEIPILSSTWGVSYTVTLTLPPTDLMTAIIDNLLDARASIVDGPDAALYQPPFWPVMRLLVDNSGADATENVFKIKAGQDPLPTNEQQIKNGRITFVTEGNLNYKVAGKTVAAFNAVDNEITMNVSLPEAPDDNDEILIIP